MEEEPEEGSQLEAASAAASQAPEERLGTPTTTAHALVPNVGLADPKSAIASTSNSSSWTSQS